MTKKKTTDAPKATEEVKEKVRYSDEELQEFKALINEKLAQARADYEDLKAIVTHSQSNDTGADTSPD